jgi:hypothetical protein
VPNFSAAQTLTHPDCGGRAALKRAPGAVMQHSSSMPPASAGRQNRDVDKNFLTIQDRCCSGLLRALHGAYSFAVSGAHLWHLPRANDVAAPPTTSNQSAFTLSQVGEQSAHRGRCKESRLLGGGLLPFQKVELYGL